MAVSLIVYVFFIKNKADSLPRPRAGDLHSTGTHSCSVWVTPFAERAPRGLGFRGWTTDRVPIDAESGVTAGRSVGQIVVGRKRMVLDPLMHPISMAAERFPSTGRRCPYRRPLGRPASACRGCLAWRRTDATLAGQPRAAVAERRASVTIDCAVQPDWSSEGDYRLVVSFCRRYSGRAAQPAWAAGAAVSCGLAAMLLAGSSPGTFSAQWCW